jgi:hypothetical protein
VEWHFCHSTSKILHLISRKKDLVPSLPVLPQFAAGKDHKLFELKTCLDNGQLLPFKIHWCKRERKVEELFTK